MTSHVLALAFAAAAAFSVAAGAGMPARSQTPAAETRQMRLGYVELADDPRYDEDVAYARIQLRPRGRPFAAVGVALGEAAMIGRVLDVEFGIERFAGASVGEVAATVRRWAAEGRQFVLADLAARDLLAVADRVSGLDVVLFNIAAPDSALRGAECRANVVHVLPSYDMQTDALVQYLVLKTWRDILVLKGSSGQDEAMARALQRSARKFGARVVATRPFVLTNDPRAREQSNVAIMTAEPEHDVVFVADSDGEFARYVPYQTNLPRPVVGAAGLVPQAWHWSWERHGAPQLNSRFEDAADRRMTGVDWAAWMAVKAVVQSVLRTRSVAFAQVRGFMLGQRMNLDGFKGYPGSFRPWNRQLRQPMLLATQNAVIARAPIRGFLHRIDNLDTLGADEPESACRT